MTADEEILNVKATLTLKKAVTLENIKNKVLEAIKKYYKDVIKEEWENGEWTVRISQIENRILNIEGVLDISNTLLILDTGLNHEGNFNDYSYRIPIVKEVNINVIN